MAETLCDLPKLAVYAGYARRDLDIDTRNTQSAITKTSVDFEKLTKSGKTVHLVGIGGIGMSALARLVLAQGKKVSGSDKSGSDITKELEASGAKIYIGHNASNVADAGLMVVSTAISRENPEMAEAERLNLPVWHRSDLLCELTKQKKLIGVSGTHGKTTTTGMVSQILLDGKLEPSVVVGGIFEKIKANSIHGDGQYFVAEIDESDGTQIKVDSYISIITNIEGDHLENYPGGLAQIQKSMLVFAEQTKGKIILCMDDAGCRELAGNISPGQKSKLITYGTKGTPETANCDYTFESPDSFSMRVYHKDELLGTVAMSVPGEHNKANALSAIITGLLCGLDFETINKSISQFVGVNRRFQILGQSGGVLIVDDYAHHPTEVVATLKAAQDYLQVKGKDQGLKRVVILFQPHQPSRLKDHWQDFCRSFKYADLVLMSDVYIARGKSIDGINSEVFSKEVDHKQVKYIGGAVSDIASNVMSELEPGDLLLTVGAGDITNIGPKLLTMLSLSEKK